MGRRPKPAGEGFTERLYVKTTVEMKQALESLATARGMDISDLVRAVLEREIASNQEQHQIQIIGEAALEALKAAGYCIKPSGE